MEFYTQNKLQRPVRLCESTRQFAFDSLNQVYGKDTLKVMDIPLDDIENLGSLSPLEKYDTAISEIAKKTPIRICKGEKISGSASLGSAIRHAVPVTYEEKLILSSVSHLTVDFETVLKYGMNSVWQSAKDAMIRYQNTEKEPFIKSCLTCLSAFSLWHSRYLEALSNSLGNPWM